MPLVIGPNEFTQPDYTRVSAQGPGGTPARSPPVRRPNVICNHKVTQNQHHSHDDTSEFAY